MALMLLLERQRGTKNNVSFKESYILYLDVNGSIHIICSLFVFHAHSNACWDFSLFCSFFQSRSQMEMVITETCSQKVRLKSKVECWPGTLKLSGPGFDIYNNTSADTIHINVSVSNQSTGARLIWPVSELSGTLNVTEPSVRKPSACRLLMPCEHFWELQQYPQNHRFVDLHI